MEARVLEISASHERRSDPLPQGNGSRHRQVFPRESGKEHAPREALRHLVTTPRSLLDRPGGYAKQLCRAPWAATVTTIAAASIIIRLGHFSTGSGAIDIIHVPTTTSPQEDRRTITLQPHPQPQRANEGAVTRRAAVETQDPDSDSGST